MECRPFLMEVRANTEIARTSDAITCLGTVLVEDRLCLNFDFEFVSGEKSSRLPGAIVVPRLSLSNLKAQGESNARTKHARLREYLLAEIREGRLKPGELLPSEQTLAESLGVARNTVRQAIASLKQDGFIVGIRRKGAFVHESAQEKFQTRSTALYALIVPETQWGFYPHFLKSFRIAAESAHHQVIVCDTGNQVDRQGNAILQLIDREIAGVAIVPTTTPAGPSFQIRQLQKHNIPVVFCSRRVEGVRAPLIQIPFEQIGQVAAKTVLDAGHREIALCFPHLSESTYGYESGFRKTILSQGLSESVHLQIFYGENASPDTAPNDEYLNEFLGRTVYNTSHPVTVIFSSFDSFTEVLYLKLTLAGYRIPDDISLIGFGGSLRNSALLNQLSAVSVDEIQMGKMALKYLNQMRRKEIPMESDDVVYASIKLHPGESLTPPSMVQKRIK